MTVIPAGFAEILFSIEHVAATRPYAITFGVDISAAAGDLEDVASTINQAFIDSTLAARWDSSLSLAEIVVRSGATPPPGPVLNFPTTTVGGTAFETPPVNTALLVRKNTALGGRHQRGRFYWPGFIAETDVDEVGNVAGAAVTAIQADFVSFHALLRDGFGATPLPLPMVLLHDALAPSTVPTPITSLSVQGVIATQRRRVRR